MHTLDIVIICLIAVSSVFIFVDLFKKSDVDSVISLGEKKSEETVKIV